MRFVKIILKCTVPSEKYGRLLLASPPETRYPYVYPRDTSCAVQLFRRLVGSPAGYDAADDAFELMSSMAHFMKDVQEEDGSWGQRYHADGEGRHIYAQEDNIAHGVSIIRRINPEGTMDLRPDFTLLSPFYLGLIMID